MIPKAVFREELIGKEIEIIDSTNPVQRGWIGKIIDETKMSITINHQGEKKMLLKSSINLKVLATGKIISGKTITQRPEERIKGR